MTPPAHAPAPHQARAPHVPALPIQLALALALLLGISPTLDARPAQDRTGGEARSIASLRAESRPIGELKGEVERLEALLARGDADAARLCRAAHLALTLALVAGDRDDEEDHAAWVRRAESYAREAARLRPASPEPRFLIGAALGLRTAHESAGERIRTAAEIREHADAILALDPSHAGGLHLTGQLNAAAKRLNPFVRFLARTVFGAEALAGASWDAAEAAFRAAIEAEPGNPSHRIELALLLRDTGRAEEARSQLGRVIIAGHDDPLSEHYWRRALEVLESMNQ